MNYQQLLDLRLQKARQINDLVSLHQDVFAEYNRLHFEKEAINMDMNRVFAMANTETRRIDYAPKKSPTL